MSVLKKALAAGLFLFVMWAFGVLVDYGLSLPASVAFPVLGALLILTVLAVWLTL